MAAPMKPEEPMVELDADDAPELTADILARARPAREVLTEAQQASFKRPAGRPKAAAPKVVVSLRLSPRIVAHFKGDNPEGWQKRVAAALEAVVDRG